MYCFFDPSSATWWIAQVVIVRMKLLQLEVQAYLKGRVRGQSRREIQAQMSIKVPHSTIVYLEDSALTYAGHTV